MNNKYPYIANAIRIKYDAIFGAPLLDLARTNFDVLKKFHEIISPRYFIPLSGLQSFGGNSLEDVRIRIELFEGKGVFELTPQKLAVNFTGIISESDMTIVKDCLTLGLDAVKSCMPDAIISGEFIGLTSSLHVTEDDFVAYEHINKLLPFGKLFPLELYGAKNAKHGFTTQFTNSDELWSVYFGVAPSASMDSDIDFTLTATYELGTKFANIYEKAEHLDKISDIYLDKLGLVAKKDESL